jgi:hypothetical protein
MTERVNAKAVYLNLPAEPYLATLLAGPNSPIDLNWHGAERLRRLRTLIGESPPALTTLSLGELAAMSWLVERLTQQHAIRQLGARILAVDFDQMLRQPAETMEAVARHLGIKATTDYLASVATSPVLARYSKAPEFAYSAQLRAQLLAEARSTHAHELRKGLQFLESLGTRHAQVANVLLV